MVALTITVNHPLLLKKKSNIRRSDGTYRLAQTLVCFSFNVHSRARLFVRRLLSPEYIKTANLTRIKEVIYRLGTPGSNQCYIYFCLSSLDIIVNRIPVSIWSSTSLMPKKKKKIIHSLNWLYCYVMICILFYGCQSVESYGAELQHARKR